MSPHVLFNPSYVDPRTFLVSLCRHTSDEESVIVMQMPKKTRKEIICLDDLSDDENDKENAPNNKHYKKG